MKRRWQDDYHDDEGDDDGGDVDEDAHHAASPLRKLRIVATLQDSSRPADLQTLLAEAIPTFSDIMCKGHNL